MNTENPGPLGMEKCTRKEINKLKISVNVMRNKEDTAMENSL